jgi:hypothetical protein
MRLDSSIAAIACCLLASAAVAQTTVYRWVDEHGRVHYAETVPERYRSGARAITVPAAPPPRELPGPGSASPPASAAAPAAPTRAPAASALPRPSGKRPARVPDQNTDCQTWQRLYLESADCFGPYRTARGGIKPEAFERCNEVPEPPIDRCRLRLP